MLLKAAKYGFSSGDVHVYCRTCGARLGSMDVNRAFGRFTGATPSIKLTCFSDKLPRVECACGTTNRLPSLGALRRHVRRISNA